ncbi:uncharacterized protein V1513DRAFT_453743 [Lipomyces chichibuensis]|uniref:uncharacterized protein n=1 Tax=Lipomyces chichibuensis TaxID=1546026 RepID=UPI0033442BBE
MRNLLSMFAGINLKSRLVGRSINGPSNIFCTDHFTHTLFDKFIIGVEYVNQQYKLRKVVTRKAVGPFIARAQDGEELLFGRGPEGATMDLPDGELFNIHLSIADVLHASGAGEVIEKVLQDEDDYKGIVKDEGSCSKILAFALRQALNGLKADMDESFGDDDCEDDKLRQRENSALRAITNLQGHDQ